MKRLTNGRYITRGYFYRGYEVRNRGYHVPDRCIWWEAINIHTGCADHHAHSKQEIKELIDQYGDALTPSDTRNNE